MNVSIFRTIFILLLIGVFTIASQFAMENVAVASSAANGTLPTHTIFTQIVTGGNYSCGLTEAGGVKCWGYNWFSQLGDGTTINRSIPVDVVGLSSGVTKIATHASTTCALLTNGSVKCWGYNGFGQLGNGDTEKQLTPADVIGLSTGVSLLAVGDYHGCAVMESGEMYCWGRNQSGQLGDGTTTDRLTPVAVNGLSDSVRMIALGRNHTCIVTNAGALKCWGANDNGQLGDGTTTNRSTPTTVSGLTSGIAMVATAAQHTCAVTTSGGVKCWGFSGFVGSNDLDNSNQQTPVDVQELSDKVMAISTSHFHTCALLETKNVMCWGMNDNGQLGDGTIERHQLPVAVTGLTGVAQIAAGGGHTCALIDGGRIRCWGEDQYGELASARAIQQRIPVDLQSMETYSHVATGSAHTCAITLQGGVQCWGDNWRGQLGNDSQEDGSTPSNVFGLSSNVQEVTAGGSHSCALTTQGAVKCWGYNYLGSLGDGTNWVQRLTPVDTVGLTSNITQIAAGGFHTCALTSAGAVKCWGDNWGGQIGDGSNTNRNVPTDVTGLGNGIQSVALGGNHTCALTDQGGVKCWGDNTAGQLGNGTTTSSSIPVAVNGLTSGVIAITVGSFHSCALTENRQVKCWGANWTGQLGNGTVVDSLTPVDVIGLNEDVVQIDAGGWNSCAIATSGALYCWGHNVEGKLGNGTTADATQPTAVSGLTGGVADIQVGSLHVCARLESGRIKCWGADSDGQLGIGAVTHQYHPIPIVETATATLAINYGTGKTGSFFTLTGTNFPANGTATLLVNGVVLTDTLAVNETGGFITFLDTSGADNGYYVVTASVNPSASTNLILKENAPLRAQEGGGTVSTVPAGIALEVQELYLPIVAR